MQVVIAAEAALLRAQAIYDLRGAIMGSPSPPRKVPGEVFLIALWSDDLTSRIL